MYFVRHCLYHKASCRLVQARAPVVLQWSFCVRPWRHPFHREAAMRRSTDYLTDRRIRSLKAQEQQYEVTDGGAPGAVAGLALRVFPTGSKSWFLRYGPREA